MKDPLLNEIRVYRDRYAAAHNYDVREIARDLQSREKKSAVHLKSAGANRR
jgi:hypothetical protein